MNTPEKLVERIVEQINEVVSQTSASREDIKQNLKQLVHSQLSKLDVVSREEFEVQQLILEKARSQIDQLKHQLEELEKRIDK